ncbi:hypothetical protein HGG82_08005 [Marinomonas sp. M1K-6]|uniref:Uncharacterized protein n=1 Tax=Marinomonas profundi TaxID=2726122 RepID=A0A847R1F6_9GAMM|nr:hypothetical protein [Marinomonas profundi]NLQ17571.1 hypothetical protein [Marinomonas profundi]UDV02212.1 hypothetical protein J8N69_11475 [Marinomonas profundi]
MDMQSIKNSIEAAYENHGYCFGIRAMTGVQTAEVGSILPNSYHWEDGVSTGNEIDGTCAIGFDVEFGEIESEQHFLKMVELVKNTYSGQVVVICGSQNIDEPHNDQDEVVIKNAKVISII